MGIRSRVKANSVGAAIALATLCVSAQLGSCGKSQRPPSHPSVNMRDRSAARIDLVTLVIDDSQRAARVRAAYEAIDALADEFNKTRAATIKQLLALSEAHALPEEEVRAQLWKLRAAGKDAYPKYVALQLEIRKNTTPDEFAKLNEVR
jgi:hypothetical protein